MSIKVDLLMWVTAPHYLFPISIQEKRSVPLHCVPPIHMGRRHLIPQHLLKVFVFYIHKRQILHPYAVCLLHTWVSVHQCSFVQPHTHTHSTLHSTLHQYQPSSSLQMMFLCSRSLWQKTTGAWQLLVSILSLSNSLCSTSREPIVFLKLCVCVCECVCVCVGDRVKKQWRMIWCLHVTEL